jgi:hypothetical protein
MPKLRKRRRQRRHRVINMKKRHHQRYIERKRAAALLYPWTVAVEYPGFHGIYDELLRKIAKGFPHGGSGFNFFDGARDNDWMCKTYEQARTLADKFLGLPGIKEVTIRGNLTEEEEVRVANLPEQKDDEPRERSPRRRRRRSARRRHRDKSTRNDAGHR